MRVAEIKRLTAVYYGLTRAQMEGRRGSRYHARARQIAMALCRYYSTASFPQIARAFGGRDHTTAMHAHHRVMELSADRDFCHELALLCAQIEAGFISQPAFERPKPRPNTEQVFLERLAREAMRPTPAMPRPRLLLTHVQSLEIAA